MIAVARRLGLSRQVVIPRFALNVLSIAFEAIGVGMLLPIFELLRAGGSVESAELKGRVWDTLRQVSGSLGLSITLELLLAVSFGLIVLRQVIHYLNARFFGTARRRLANDIRRRAVDGFLNAETHVQERTRVGEIAANLTVELDRALGAMFAMVRSLGTLVQISIYLAGLFLLSPAMTLLSIGVIGLAGFFGRGIFSKVKQAGAAISQANRQLTAFIVERLKHARLIRLSGTERAEAAAFAELSDRHASQVMHQKLVQTRLTLIPEPIAIGFAYLVLFLGARVFGLSLERLGFFVVVLIRLMPVVRSVINDYNTILGQWPSVRRLDRQLTRVLAGREPTGGGGTFARLNRDIVYDRVSFSYAGSEVPALHDVTVTLPAHRMSALVGPSGAGKSTFVDLLPRLRDPTGGQLLLDGVPLQEFSVASLRAGIAFVPQQPQIFNISAAQHIRYGKEDATDEEVREAARLAGALEFIDALPNGFDTPLGDGGLRLSGGQRQRLDIARALVRRAPILILDEPSSALDAEAEGVFRDALRKLRAETDLTIIVIAHRLSTIADAEKIVVLKEGRVDAAGTHEELMAAGGWYAESYAQQVNARDRLRVGAA